MPTTPLSTNEEITKQINYSAVDGFDLTERIIKALDAKDREREEAVTKAKREQIMKDINLAKNADDYGDEGITRHVIVESLRDQLTPTQE